MQVENYRRQQKSQEEVKQEQNLPTPEDNEIRITTHGKLQNYVSRGMELLQVNHLFCFRIVSYLGNWHCNPIRFQEKKFSSIILTGQGKAINKTVSATEIIKRQLDGSLHQYTQIGSVKTRDVWEPVQQNLDK